MITSEIFSSFFAAGCNFWNSCLWYCRLSYQAGIPVRSVKCKHLAFSLLPAPQVGSNCRRVHGSITMPVFRSFSSWTVLTLTTGGDQAFDTGTCPATSFCSVAEKMKVTVTVSLSKATQYYSVSQGAHDSETHGNTSSYRWGGHLLYPPLPSLQRK